MSKSKYILTTVVITALLSTTAFAYLDPSVMTQLVQAIAGIVIAVGAVVGVYFYKIKKKVTKAMNLEETTKKEVEDELVIFDNESSKE